MSPDKMKKWTLTYFILCLFFAISSFAQQSGIAIAKLDTNRIRIGEQIKVNISFSYNPVEGKKLVWPEIGDTIRKEIEVISKTKPEQINTKGSGGTKEFRQTVIVTSFDSGFWVIPPFKFYLEGDTAPFAETNPLLVEVQTLPVDTAETSLRDIKPIFEEKWDWRVLLPYIYWGAGILAVLAIALYIIYRLRKKKKDVPVRKELPKEPPHITALRSLEQIRARKLWQEGKYKEYYTAVTDVLRLYIEGRYKVHAMELTTDEILQVMRSQVIDSESKRKLHQILELADFVKFAKAVPIEAENELTLQNAFDFVNGTKREEPTVNNIQTPPGENA